MVNAVLKESEDLIREFLDYDPDTGIVTWAKRRCRRSPAGAEAGWDNGSGYRKIMIGGKRFATHRVAWFLHYGAWPEREIDHINGVRYDNRISNMRDVTHQENHGNRPPHRNGKLVGYSLQDNGRCRSRISVNGKDINLGNFDTELEAHQAYMKARRVYAEIQQLRECV